MIDPDEGPKSKSQRKREAQASQALGESLTTLAASELARLPLWPKLEAAVTGARGLERAALRRQIRYIGRVLRDGDIDAVAQGLEAVRRPGQREAARHHRLERLRDALLDSNEAFGRVREAKPELDFQKLRRLVTAARREREGAPGGASERRLFRFLRDGGVEG